MKYVSDRYAGEPYAPISIPQGASFADMVALKAAQLCAADRGLISMQDGDLYRVRAVYGFSREAEQYALENPRRPDSGSVTGRVLLEGEATGVTGSRSRPTPAGPGQI